MNTGLACALDIGGTKAALALVDDAGQIVHETRVPSRDASPQTLAAAVAELVSQAPEPVVGVGIGVAGYVSADRSAITFCANIDWPVEDLPDTLREALNLPVVVENDANCAAWGEYRFGAGVGVEHLLMATVGTGVGGGVVLGGVLERGAHGIAAELGHVLVVRDGAACECGARGCLEQYASGSALDRAAAAAGLDVVGPELMQAARGGDARAVAAFAEVGGWLGHGLASAADLLDPDRIVVGGGVAEAGDLLLEPARAAFAAGLTGARYREIAPIVAAQLGNDAGVVGAADLARHP